MSRPHRLAALALAGALIAGCGDEPTATDYLERARTRDAAGETQAALIEARNAVRTDESNVEARLLLGRLLLARGDAVGAASMLETARALGADDDASLALLTEALVRTGRGEDALALPDVADAMDAEASGAMLAWRALARAAGGERIEAETTLERAESLAPDARPVRLARARLDLAAGRTDRAIRTLDAWVEDSAQDAEAWSLLGDAHRAQGNAAGAIAAYDAAVEHAGGSLDALVKRAAMHLAGDDHVAAGRDYEALEAAGVESPAVDTGFGQMDLRAGKLAAAQVRFEQALTRAPDYPPALSGLTLTHLALGNHGQAEQYAKQLDGENDASRLLLAAVRLQSGRDALAADTIAPVVRAEPRNVSAGRLLASAQLREGRYDDAVDTMLSLAAVAAPADRGGAATLAMVRDPVDELLNPGRPAVTTVDPEAGSAPPSPSGDGGPSVLDDRATAIAEAVAALAAGRHDEVLERAEALRARFPGDALPDTLAARAHAALDDLDAARAALERAVDLEPADVTANLLLAELDARAGEIDAAIARVDALIDDERGPARVLLVRARLAAAAGDEADAVRWTERAREQHPDAAMATLVLARRDAALGDHAAALAALETLDERTRGTPAVLEAELRSLLGVQRFDEALERADRLVALAPGVAETLFLRAASRAGTGDLDGSVADLERAVELDPDHVGARAALARSALLQGDEATYRTQLDALRERAGDDPNAAAMAAALERGASAPPPGSAGTNGPAAIDGSDEVLAQAREAWRDGRSDEAVDVLKRWLETTPDDARARMTLANTYTALGRGADAVAEYETVLAEDPAALGEAGRLAALNNLAWELRDREPERAATLARQALDIVPDNVATLDTLAVIELGRGELDAAAAAFERARELGADDPTILYNGARIAAARGDDATARELLEPLVRDGSRSFPEADAARALLEELDARR